MPWIQSTSEHWRFSRIVHYVTPEKREWCKRNKHEGFKSPHIDEPAIGLSIETGKWYIVPPGHAYDDEENWIGPFDKLRNTKIATPIMCDLSRLPKQQ